MMQAELIFKYFPDLSPWQQNQFNQLKGLYQAWNAKINVISRKDMDRFYVRHVLPATAMRKIIPFRDGSRVVDVGTGGGFPGIPLAILYPGTQFTLIDGTAKKIRVVSDVIRQLGLDNVKAQQAHSTGHKGKYDFVLGRAVKAFPQFYAQTSHLFRKENKHPLPNGYFYFSGGDSSQEMQGLGGHEIFELKFYFDEEELQTKHIIYCPA